MKPLYKVEYRLPEGAVTQVTVPACDEAEAQRRAHRVARRRYPLVHVSLVRCWRFSPDAARFGGAMDRVRKVLGMVAIVVVSLVAGPMSQVQGADEVSGLMSKVQGEGMQAGPLDDSRDLWAFMSWLIETEALWIAAWGIVGIAAVFCLVMGLRAQSDVRVKLPVPDWADEIAGEDGAVPASLIPSRMSRDGTTNSSGAGALTAERREKILNTLHSMWGPQSTPYTDHDLEYSFALTKQQVVALLAWANGLVITTRVGQWRCVVEKGIKVQWLRFVKLAPAAARDGGAPHEEARS